MKGISSIIVLFCLTAGCTMQSQEPIRYQATIQTLSNTQKHTLEEAVSQMFAGVPITLADDAFKNSSQITIERRPSVDDRGLLVEGRHNNPARSFSLFKQGEVCLLRDDANKLWEPLPGVSCTAIAVEGK